MNQGVTDEIRYNLFKKIPTEKFKKEGNFLDKKKFIIIPSLYLKYDIEPILIRFDENNNRLVYFNVIECNIEQLSEEIWRSVKVYDFRHVKIYSQENNKTIIELWS
jgi:hypothetical protein